MLSAGIFMLGAAFIGFAVAPTLALACIASMVGGIGNGLEWPSLISLVQRLTPQRLHGRLMGAVESIGALCLAIGLPLGGALVAISSARVAFLVLGLGFGERDCRVRAPDADRPRSRARRRTSAPLS